MIAFQYLGDAEQPSEPCTTDAGGRVRLVANAMADSEHAPMSEAIFDTATGQLAVASDAGTYATAISRQ